MKKPRIDPLEETMENPDLPPLAPAQGPESASARSPARRGLRVTLTIGAVLIVLAAVGLRFAGG